MDWPKPHQGVLAKRNVEHVKELHSWVSEQPEGDARLTLERILNTLKEEVARINLASSLRELGWAVRNIYELRVFARFVLQSDANLERFLTDYDVDGCEVAIRLGAFLKAHETYFPKVSTDIEELRELVESAKAYRQEKLHGLEKSRPLNVRDLAADLNMLAEYQDIHKITSKLVHPTRPALATSSIAGSSRKLPALS
jgi:hypothetical protein